MKKKKIIFTVIIVMIVISAISIIQINEDYFLESDEINDDPAVTSIPYDDPLFLIRADHEDIVEIDEDGLERYDRYLLTENENNDDVYTSLGPKNSNQTTVVIIPLFTSLAYTDGGFYDYFAGACDLECLTVNGVMVYSTLKFDYRSSAMANQVFEILGYDRISDADVDSDPTILKKYDKVILLHNEYVTKTMFDAITRHPKVIYLYPNALYAEISADGETSSITLIRGHGYPEKNIVNGFDWEFENTHPFEFDTKCVDWDFYKIDNGFMLNCYPENIIFTDVKLLQTILEL